MAMEPFFTLKTKEGLLTNVDREVLCKFSEAFRTMVQDCAELEPQDQGDREAVGADADIINLEHIGKPTLDLVIRWATYHHANPSDGDNVDLDEIPRDQRAGHMSDWDKEFIGGLTHEQLSAIFVALDFLAIDKLETLAVQQLILNFRGKSIEEIRAMVGAPPTLPPELQEKIDLENSWIAASNEAHE